MPRPDLGDALGQNVGRFIAGVFGLVFAGIGVATIIFVWGFDDHAPFFFQIVASFISLAFVAMGGGLAFAAISGRLGATPMNTLRRKQADLLSAFPPPPPPPASPAASPSTGYQCPGCGAPLSNDADVSPSGDVKCTFCNRWFNIHHPAAP